MEKIYSDKFIEELANYFYEEMINIKSRKKILFEKLSPTLLKNILFSKKIIIVLEIIGKKYIKK